MSIKAFRKDIQQGMPLEEAFQKHKLTLNQVFTTLHTKTRYHHKKKNKPPAYTPIKTPYIYNYRNKYYIVKNTRKKSRTFGSYNTLEEAIQVRDELIKDGWHQTHVDRICDELGIQRNKGHHNQKVRYH
jgi:hypothetical protein